jgi:hypothetical protein
MYSAGTESVKLGNKEYTINHKSHSYLMYYTPHFSSFFDYYQVYLVTKCLEEGITAALIVKYTIRSYSLQ